MDFEIALQWQHERLGFRRVLRCRKFSMNES